MPWSLLRDQLAGDDNESVGEQHSRKPVDRDRLGTMSQVRIPFVVDRTADRRSHFNCIVRVRLAPGTSAVSSSASPSAYDRTSTRPHDIALTPPRLRQTESLESGPCGWLRCLAIILQFLLRRRQPTARHLSAPAVADCWLASVGVFRARTSSSQARYMHDIATRLPLSISVRHTHSRNVSAVRSILPVTSRSPPTANRATCAAKMRAEPPLPDAIEVTLIPVQDQSSRGSEAP